MAKDEASSMCIISTEIPNPACEVKTIATMIAGWGEALERHVVIT